MTIKRMAWKMLRTLRDAVVVQEQDPRPAEVEEVIYNPYKKIYIKRKPTVRKSAKQELQLLLQANDNDKDHLWIGDKMSEVNEQGTIRLWLQNWNGAEKWDPNKIMYQLSTLVDNNIHYFSIIESKINQYHKETADKWKRCQERIMPNGDILLSSVPGVPTDTPGQPGGIISGYNGPLKTKYMTSHRDPMGRWHYQEFYGKERNLRIYSMYRVNPGVASSEGDTTYWTQQKNYMNLSNDSRNPRKAVIEDFIQEIQQAIDKKISIIIMADFNERVDGPEKNNEKFRELGLINLMQEYVGIESLPRTCTKGPNCIDHIWMTANVLENVHRAGFAPFDFIKASDHRGIYVDLFYKNVLDDSMHNLEPMKRRNLKSTIPSRVEKYIEVVQDQWEYHRITRRFLDIQESMQTEVLEEHIVELNKLDKQITEILLYGERKCSNVPAHSIGAWSVKLKNAIRTVIEMATKRTRAKKLKPDTNVEEAIENFKEADKNWKDAKEEYKNVQKNAKELRKDHIRECAEKNVERDGNKTVESEIRRLQTIEEQRNTADRLKCVMKPFSRAGFTTVMIPAITAYSLEERREEGFNHHDINRMWNKILPYNGKDITDWERITDKKIVHELMLQWQRKHFTQAQESPCGNTEWNDILRNKDIQQQILDGNYAVPNEMPIELQEIFDQMKRPDCVTKELPYHSTYREFISFIKGSSESRSTSPSGRGYNHYKSLLIGEAREQLETIHDIIELARSKNIILDRWKNTVTTLMEKDSGKPKIHRMRALHIIEAEVQFIAKLFYCKKLLQNAEKHDLITGQQYGGRKNKQAQSVVLNKMMYYNITHQQLTEAAFMDDDARNCYDRILTAMSAVELRSWGQSYEEANFSTEFLQQQKYFVKTGLGITDNYYTYSRDDPTHGSGQGIGWAGVKFTRTSDTVCKIMQDKCAGMEFCDPQKKYIVKKNGDIFVDDTAIGVTMNCATKQNALLQLKEDQQKHSYLLFSCGHKLALDKCAFYWIRFIRDGIHQRHCLIHELPGELHVREGYNMVEKQVKRLQPFECHRTLGHFVSVNGNQKRQKKELKKKISEWCDKLRTRYLNGSDTIFAHKSHLLPALRYMMSSSCLSYKECNELGKKLEPILFNAFSIQRNCARVVLYAPMTFGGFGIEHLYHVQCLEKMKFFFMHLRKNDVTGQLFRICMEWTQREVGTRRHFFQTDFVEHSKRITPTWITHLWEYAQRCKMEFYDTTWEAQLHVRKNDFYLMDAIAEAPLSVEQKHRFNQIRLSLKIETAADIVQWSSGTQICPNIYNCITYRGSIQGWPNILDYPIKWKEEWKNILQNYIEPKLQSRPLGRWLRKSHQISHANISEDLHILQINGQYYIQHETTRVYTPTNEEANCVIPVDIETHMNGYKIISLGPTEWPGETQNLLSTLEPWERRNLGTADFEAHHIQPIIQALQTNNVVAASDGSVLNGLAAHAYCLAQKDTNDVIMSAVAPVDGKSTTMTSFRPEAMGALAVIQFVDHLTRMHNIPSTTIRIYIDNAETIQVMNGEKNLHRFSVGIDDHHDVAIELYKRVKNSPNKYIPEKVKGHMDDTNNELTRSQELNVYVDGIVGEFIHNPLPRLYPHEHSPTLAAQQIVLLQNNIPVVTDIKETLILSQMEEELIKYNMKHHSMDLTVNVFDTKTLGRVLANNKQKVGKRIKNLQNQWDTRERNMSWGKAKSNICTLCNQKVECWRHVYNCPCIHMKRKSSENMRNIEKKLQQVKTEPTMLKLILHLIRHWNNPENTHEVPHNSPYFDLIHEAFSDQQQLGFEAFAKGFVSMKWKLVQDAYYRQEIRDRKYNIERWSQTLVNALVDRGNILWEERCTILATANMDTEEKRYRTYLQELLIQTRDQQQLNSKDYHILQRKPKFFSSAPRATLEMWHLRLNGMIEYERERRKKEGSDIRKFIQRTKRPRKQKRRKQTTIRKNTYQQKTLWTCGIIRSSETHPVTQTRTMNPTQAPATTKLTHKRKNLLENLSRRRKRHCQTTLRSQNTDRQPRRLTRNLSRLHCKKRKRSSSSSTRKRHKENRPYVPVKQRMSVRDIHRKYGKDLKNDR